MDINAITGRIVDTAIQIHRRLGPGLLESVYHAIIEHELRKQGLQVEREVPISLDWDGLRLDLGFRADLIVERAVIVELKSVESTAPVHKKQVLTYLKVTGLSVGLLLNFGEATMKDGICRLVNSLTEEGSSDLAQSRGEQTTTTETKPLSTHE